MRRLVKWAAQRIIKRRQARDETQRALAKAYFFTELQRGAESPMWMQTNTDSTPLTSEMLRRASGLFDDTQGAQ